MFPKSHHRVTENTEKDTDRKFIGKEASGHGGFLDSIIALFFYSVFFSVFSVTLW
jgi:hypothetical protein